MLFYIFRLWFNTNFYLCLYSFIELISMFIVYCWNIGQLIADNLYINVKDVQHFITLCWWKTVSMRNYLLFISYIILKYYDLYLLFMRQMISYVIYVDSQLHSLIIIINYLSNSTLLVFDYVIYILLIILAKLKVLHLQGIDESLFHNLYVHIKGSSIDDLENSFKYKINKEYGHS